MVLSNWRVRVVPYDPSWPRVFADEAARIEAALGDLVARIHHIGSTSVPGLAAKPIIDIFVQVHGLDALDHQTAALTALGYDPWGEYGLPGRRYFPKGERPRTHHLHAFDVANPEPLRYLHFRDYLCTHPEVMAAYADIKYHCAEQNQGDAQGYCDCKDSFVVEYQAQALRWACG